MVIQEESAKRVFGIRASSLLRFALGIGGAIVVLGLAAPFVNAGGYRTGIQDALQDALGRKVKVGAVHFNLFTGPGFSLDDVTISEDPHYGLEPFAYIPTLELRVRLDKLLLGQIRPLGLRMVDASLNLVKADDGTWNAVTLVERLGRPRRTPLNFFPAVQISNGRVDFKLGTRKTTLYITNTELSIYPESSGKIYFKFEGSPARTDRAGNGFGHLTGTANWYLTPASAKSNELEADVNLEPSNLSEMTTLFEGQDLGVHGTVSAHVLISGPFSDLRAFGDMQLQDVHRWDLLPSPGDSLRVRFRSNIDLRDHTFQLSTLPPQGSNESPVTLQLRANNFMTTPTWAVLASMRKAPLASLLPLARRMGMALPAGLQMDGALDGVVGYSSTAGVEGGVVITNAVANIPNVPPFRSASAHVTISGNRVRIEPAILQSDSGGTLRAGGDFDLATQDMEADISADQVSAAAFKATTTPWFAMPDALALITDGKLSGHFLVSYSAASSPERPVWSGQVQFTDVTMAVPGIASPVEKMQGKATFDALTFDLPRMAGTADLLPFTGSYHYSLNAKRLERLHLDFAKADLAQIEAALTPALSDDSLLSRLPFTRRTIPLWLESRDMEGDVSVARFSLNGVALGSMAAHFLWHAATVQLTGFDLGLPAGKLQGSATVLLTARLPRYHFMLQINGLPWGGGVLGGQGVFDTSGMGLVAFQNLKGSGTFTGEDIALNGSEPFTAAHGQFEFAFSDNTPVLRLTRIEADQNEQEWAGDGATDAAGKLHLDLNSGERQLHLNSELLPVSPPQP